MKKHIGEVGLFVIAIIWGSGFIGTKLALDGGLSPIQTLTLRFFIASIILGVIFYCCYSTFYWIYIIQKKAR